MCPREAHSTVQTMYAVIFIIVLTSVPDANTLGKDVPQRPVFHRLGKQQPPRPFTATWNVNYTACWESFGVNLELEKFNIDVNKPGEVSFIKLFGHAGISMYPYLKGGKFVNGGLPQLVNMTSYLEKATDDITNAIPDENFSGLVVIDWEFWSPIWDENFWPERRVYREESIAFVQRHYPDWDAAKVESVAKLEFETAGKALFEATVKLGKLLRPGGLWGFYHYPYCENNVRHVGRCNATTMKHNDQLRWLFDDTTAIYPSIYLKGADVGLNGSSAFVDATLGEAFRVREESDNPLMPMYSYCRFNYTHTKYYYTMEDLKSTVLASAEKGLNGVIFWGDHNDTHDKAACMELKAYIHSALGPLVRNITQAASSCASTLCNDHGRCTGKILECGEQKKTATYLGQSKIKSDAVDNCQCQCSCYAGWSGPNCLTKQ
ncbi:hyaluronidase-1-like [Asterias amurensis]|uniref:hyaluronidase-1-like n=1 Tax=Asterias amurensis TaxID=7602 RepID=UPI003AB41221